MAGEVIVDALPYIDQGYDEAGVREAALAMVEEETRRYRPTKNYLEHLPPLNTSLFETEMMKSEWERMQQRQPMDVLSMKRYELPPPPAGKMTDIAAWTECVENSQAQLEHQATRICNLELMLEYGCEAWKSYLELVVASVSQAQKNLQALRKDIQEINWERKNAQMKGGEKLRELEATWVGLVSKNYDIEQACVTVEEEIMRVQKVKQNALKRRRIEEERVNAKRRKLEQREQERREMLEKQREEQMRQEQLEQEAQELARKDEEAAAATAEAAAAAATAEAAAAATAATAATATATTSEEAAEEAAEENEEKHSDEQYEHPAAYEEQNGIHTEISDNQGSPNSQERSDSNQSEGSGGAEDNIQREDENSL